MEKILNEKQQPIYAAINDRDISFKCTFPKIVKAGSQATVEHLMILLGYEENYSLSFKPPNIIVTCVKCYETRKGYKFEL